MVPGGSNTHPLLQPTIKRKLRERRGHHLLPMSPKDGKHPYVPPLGKEPPNPSQLQFFLILNLLPNILKTPPGV